MCAKLNVLVLRQNALLNSLHGSQMNHEHYVVQCSPALHVHAHMYTHCFPVKRHWFLHQVIVWPRFGKLDNHDVAGYIKDKCMNTIISLLATRKQQKAKWAYFFCLCEFCCSKTFLSICLMWCRLMFDQPANKGGHMFWMHVLFRVHVYATCGRSKLLLTKWFMKLSPKSMAQKNWWAIFMWAKR